MPDRFDRERAHVGLGWQGILDRAREDLLKLAPNFDAVQIKEKFGTLRLYVMTGDGFHTGNTNEFFNRARQAERESENVCEDCGTDGDSSYVTTAPLGDKNGWYRTLCEDCRKDAYARWCDFRGVSNA